jgi:hypothetical protein
MTKSNGLIIVWLIDWIELYWIVCSILTNIIELKLENAQLLRMMAYKLDEQGFYFHLNSFSIIWTFKSTIESWEDQEECVYVKID